MNSYNVGTIVRLKVAFTAFDAPIDGDVVTLTMQAGSANAPVDISGLIVHDTSGVAGIYYADFPVDVATEPSDPHRYTWRSTGALRAVAGSRFASTLITP